MNQAAPPLSERTLTRALLIFLACFGCYAASLNGGWLWDDDSEITEHTALTRVSGLVEIWTAQSSVDFLPVKSTVQWIAYRFLGEDPAGWRLLNVLLHFSSCLLIWKVLGRLGVENAWLGGLIFAIHPLAVCTVAWISELKNTLSLPLLLAAFLKFDDFVGRRRHRDLVAACRFFVTAMFVKASGVMFPVFLLVYLWWRRPEFPAGYRLARRWMQAGLWVAPFFLISLLAGLSTMYFQNQRAIGPEELPLGGWLSRLALSGTAAWFYLYKAFLPFRLIPNYPRWDVDPPTLLQLLAWPAMLVLILWLWTKRHTWGRHALLGLAFFLLNLIPILGFVPMSYMRITWASDHLAYLSLVGVVGLVTAGLDAVWVRARENAPLLFIVLGLGLAGIFGWETQRYAQVYTSEKAMWSYTLKRNPAAWQAHSRISRVLLSEGNLDGAFFHVQEANRLRPDLPETHNNYAAALISRGDLAGARERLERAVELAPYADLFRMNLANLYVRMGDRPAALGLFAELYTRHPNNPILLTNYGASLFFDGERDRALVMFERAVQLNPNLATARVNLEEARKALSGTPPDGLPNPTGTQTGMDLLSSDSPLLFFPR